MWRRCANGSGCCAARFRQPGRLMQRRPMQRQLWPRPLPAHLASAMLLWLSSRAALTNSPAGWTNWSAASRNGHARLAALADEVAQLGRDRVAAALDREIARRAAAFLSGLDAYRRHSYRRAAPPAPVVWRAGAARLLDCGDAAGGPVVLIVPSLINRWHILDLLPERSFVRHLAAAGRRPLVLDWGEPGPTERDYGLADYICGPLAGALTAAVAANGGRPVTLLGYCMGGLLALATALLHPDNVAALALLATPWDFHAEQPGQAELLGALGGWLPRCVGDGGVVPVSVVQALFLALDPFLAERKFIRFAAMDPASEAARGFVALEDWINDGVPLAAAVALDCAHCWYRDNLSAHGLWQIAGRPVRPHDLTIPALVVLPSRDRIVPPASAAPLAAAIRGAEALRPRFGHIGMMASDRAPVAVWQPIADWLVSFR
jgi:poly[(R)-3-hydroxyalkanoate] polymerase subunit PhaC